ncbi:MAG: hypothetical protein ICV56_02685 [Nitrososphaeraceae archaeon]|nr:hypothetical protein [Nitrososphaeraceae archaeon]
MIRELLLLLYSFNIQDFIFLITSTIDIFAATIIAVSTFQTIIPMVKVTIISTLDVRNRLPSSSSAQEKLVQHDSHDTKQKGYWIKKNFVRGLLLALELESANAILKMGLFTSVMIELQPSLQLATIQNINNFIFFVAILSIRVAINQTLRRYSISR